MAQQNEIRNELMELAPSLGSVGNSMPFSVPPAYFDNFPGLILQKIKALETEDAREETSLLSATLGGMSRKMPFSVPKDYFEKLSPQADSVHKPAKVIPIPARKRVWKYAVAAIVAGLVAAELFLFISSQQSGNNQQLALNDSSTILKAVSTVSDVEIEAYANDIAEAEPMTESELREDEPALMFSEVSDAELENYLN